MCLAVFGPARPADRPAAVRLAVLVVVDQLRGDYPERWQQLFGEGGFGRLQRDGAWFANCHYPYAGTVTAAGHASLATGCSPWRHGIVGNEWYDRRRRRLVTSVADPNVAPVPESGGLSLLSPRGEGASPWRLRSETVADVLKRHTAGKAKVISLSLKDRSAILLAGQHPDGCYWLDSDRGMFVTSTWYRPRLPRWLSEFNASRPADRWFGQSWHRLRPDLDYRSHSGPDDAPGEAIGALQGREFPHPTSGGLTEPGRAYYLALQNSPFGNDLLFQAAQRALLAEQLGQDDVPDLLCLSFSSNDLIGHTWGPDSQEVLDVTLRTDRLVRELLDFLDAHVGRGRYLLALSADHGICPLPETSQARGIEAFRINPRLLTTAAEEFLEDKYGVADSGRYIAAGSHPWVYLDADLLRRRGLDPAEVEEALAGWLERQPGVQAAFTRRRLQRVNDPLAQTVRRSTDPERSGDVAVVIRPYHLLTGTFTPGTTHGTPHAYDTHVPLFVYGPEVVAGRREEAVTPLALAAILAQGLGLPPPQDAEAAVPPGLFHDPTRLTSRPTPRTSRNSSEPRKRDKSD
jgi:predicted AlkP superfamily pyrophosphatase or phosphodiesterase